MGATAAAVVSWIVAAIATAWALLSGAAAVAGTAALASAVALIPAQMGTAASTWLAVGNHYLPVNESVSLFVAFVAIAGFLKIAKWSFFLKK